MSNKWNGYIWQHAATAGLLSDVVGVLLWHASSAEHRLSAGDAGLTLQFATQFIGLLQNFFRSKTFLEVTMNDVERVDEYSSQLPLEAYHGETPPANWPIASIFWESRSCSSRSFSAVRSAKTLRLKPSPMRMA